MAEQQKAVAKETDRDIWTYGNEYGRCDTRQGLVERGARDGWVHAQCTAKLPLQEGNLACQRRRGYLCTDLRWPIDDNLARIFWMQLNVILFKG